MTNIKQFLGICFFVILFTINGFSQSLTQVILPKYIQGVSGTNNNRVFFVYRVTLSGLTANTTYRYINQIVNYADGPTTSGAGNCIFPRIDSPFVRTTSPSFATYGGYGEFTTNASGSYTGWFINEPTGNARFVAGGYVFMRIRLNDGAGGTTATTYLTTQDSVRVINFYTTSADTSGTGIYGQSTAPSKDFVFLYDNVSGTGRPLASAIVENDGLNISAVTSFVQFYRDSVDNKIGYWGTIIPNVNANGIRRIERRLFNDGSIYSSVAIDADGIWPSGANTVNPTSGLTAIRIDATDAPIPVELTGFSANIIDGNVSLTWSTASEKNNMGFEIQRNSGDGFSTIGFVNGAGTSNEINNYSFVDKNPRKGINYYRLKQIDFSGQYSFSKEIESNTELPAGFFLSQNYPNPFNPSTSIKYSIAALQKVELKVFDVLGNEVAELVNDEQQAGNYLVEFNASSLANGVYFYKLKTNNNVITKKMLLIK